MDKVLQSIDLFYKIAKRKSPKVYELEDGFVIHGDSLDPEVIQIIKEIQNKIPLIVTDPPYGKIVTDEWDNPDLSQTEFANWLLQILDVYSPLQSKGAAFYMWGGIGVQNYRPYLEFLAKVDQESDYSLSNLITWSKRRAYGTKNNYLFTREEMAYLVKGDNPKKPRKFKVPLLDELRGYEGFDKNYPAKSPYLRRTNVWTDINEMFSGKLHPTEKPPKLYEIPIEIHTSKNQFVLDMFAGSGPCAVAARNLGRKFILVEREKKYINVILNKLK